MEELLDLVSAHGRTRCLSMAAVLDETSVEWSSVKRAIVTGAAGFIGSHLSERLVAEGYSVTGIDAFTAVLRPRRQAREPRRARAARRASTSSRATSTTSISRRCSRTRRSSSTWPPSPACALSFGEGFARYTADNILATQRVLEAASAAGCPRVVWASSSSVYGDAAAYPCVEASTPTAPALALRRHQAGLRGPRRRLRQRRARAPPACATSPSTGRASARTWRCASSARRCSTARASRSTATAASRATSPTSPTRSTPRSGPGSPPTRPGSTTSAAATRPRSPRSSRCSRTSRTARPCSTAARPRRAT